MSNLPLLVAAYVLVWVFFFGYLVWLVRRQERLRRELEALRSVLASRGGPQAKGE